MSRAGYDRKRVHNGCTSSLEIRGGFREGKRKGYPVSSSRLSLSPQDRATVLLFTIPRIFPSCSKTRGINTRNIIRFFLFKNLFGIII